MVSRAPECHIGGGLGIGLLDMLRQLVREKKVMGFRGWNTKSTNKFGAKKSNYGGMVFDSNVERDRFRYLEYQQRMGEISNLHRQVRFLIIPKITKMVPTKLKTKVRYDERTVELPAYYTSDFCYIENGKYVMEDVKNAYSQDIRDYPLRRKLMVHKIKKHNAKGHGQWMFRESILKGGRLIIKDIEP